MYSDSKNTKYNYDIDESKRFSESFSKTLGEGGIFPSPPDIFNQKFSNKFGTPMRKDFLDSNKYNIFSTNKKDNYKNNYLNKFVDSESKFPGFNNEQNQCSPLYEIKDVDNSDFQIQNNFQSSEKNKLRHKLNNDFENIYNKKDNGFDFIMKENNFNNVLESNEEKSNKDKEKYFDLNIDINNNLFYLLKQIYVPTYENTNDSFMNSSSLSEIKNVKKNNGLELDEEKNNFSILCMCKKTGCKSNYCSCRKFQKKCNKKCGCIGCENKKSSKKDKKQE